MDRLSRVTKATQPNCVIGTEYFLKKTKNPGSWRLLGAYKFKGLTNRINIFQLKNMGDDIIIINKSEFEKSNKELAEENCVLAEKISKYEKEVQILRERIK